MPPLFSVGIVLFETKFLEQSLPSLFAQNFANVEFLLRDHSPDFVASKFIEQNLPEIAARAKIFRGENLWHSGGMNFLIRESRGEFFVAASADALYEPNFLVRAAEILARPENAKVGALGGKLLKWENFPESPFTKAERKPPSSRASQNSLNKEILDSVGISAEKSGRFFEIGSGKNSEKFAEEKIVFGISGALAILRRSALEEIAENGEFFDEKLHFKNDVDLAFRLNWLGWQAKFSPEIVAWHARGLGDAKPRSERSDFERENSTFGQFVVIAKNFDANFSWRVKFLMKLRLLALRTFGIFGKAEGVGIRKFDALSANLQPSRHQVAASEIEKLLV